MDRKLFHKLLGIPEHIRQPTLYTLLNVDPRQVAPDKIAEALAQRKQQLRRQVPSPQLLPMVAVFEKELDRAAQILSDPELRRAYRARLQQVLDQKRGHSTKPELTAEERKVIPQIRKLIREMSNPDGTFDEDKKPVLAEKLRAMNVGEGDIQYILSNLRNSES